MRTIKSMKEWIRFREGQAFNGIKVGFVSTMGALHDGHISLVKKSLEENDKTVVTIFINPTQFDNKDDLMNYPVDLQYDFKKLEEVGADYVLIPDPKEVYADKYSFKIDELSFSNKLCGARRKGHFAGALTVLMKFINIVKPHNIYFGAKDYQQLVLVRKMVDSFFMDLNVVACPIVRESDGLAMSSRNRMLTSDQREKASLLYKILTSGLDLKTSGNTLSDNGFKVEYFEEMYGRRFVAAKLGNVRLIDNVKI